MLFQTIPVFNPWSILPPRFAGWLYDCVWIVDLFSPIALRKRSLDRSCGQPRYDQAGGKEPASSNLPILSFPSSPVHVIAVGQTVVSLSCCLNRL
jgi:hypothetical protein